MRIDCAVEVGTGNTVSDGMRPQMHATRVAQRLDAPVIRNHVAELDDFRNAPEMFDKAGGTAERLAHQIIDGNPAVIHMRVRNSTKMFIDEVLNHTQSLTD